MVVVNIFSKTFEPINIKKYSTVVKLSKADQTYLLSMSLAMMSR